MDRLGAFLGSPLMKPGLVLQHDADLGPGRFGEWASDRRIDLVVQPPGTTTGLADLSRFSLVCSLGSHQHAFDDRVPWLASELELLRRAHSAGLPILGICFGAQALARILGGTVRPARRQEVGWIPVDLCTEDGAVSSGPWPFWHEDQFEVPPGAELLATTGIGPAAFRQGASLGVQFHPELTAEGLETVIAKHGGALELALLDALRSGTRSAGLRARSWALHDTLLDRPGGAIDE
jgi:GMP synthase-like glutamine amidotransferase